MRLVQIFVCGLTLMCGGLVTRALADGCYICGSGSSGGCQQCSYGSSDTAAARKACEKKGCKIGGTKSCSTAANVKSCSLDDPRAPTPVVAWSLAPTSRP